jgi:hypothetical protein
VNTRQELHGAAIVLIYGSSYMAAFLGLMFVFTLFGSSFHINYEMCGYFIGCIGAGELARGVCKLYCPPVNLLKYYLAVSVAGFVTVSVFWVFMVFKWGHPISSIPIAGVVGSATYIVLAWLLILEGRKNS